jgi:hypothetical protein
MDGTGRERVIMSAISVLTNICSGSARTNVALIAPLLDVPLTALAALAALVAFVMLVMLIMAIAGTILHGLIRRISATECL